MPRVTVLGIGLTVFVFSILIIVNFTIQNNYIAVTDPLTHKKGLKTIRCSNFPTQNDAQKFFLFHGENTGELISLDGDLDGVVCESLPK